MVKLDKRLGTELAHIPHREPTKPGALQVGSRLAELLVKMLE